MSVYKIYEHVLHLHLFVLQIFNEYSVTLHPDHSGLAMALVTWIGVDMLPETFVICEDSLQTDGFLQIFHTYNNMTMYDINMS